MADAKRKIKFTKRDWIFTAMLAGSHLTGIIGLSWEATDEFFTTFFPVHLLFTFALVMIAANWGIRFITFFIAAVVFIYMAELASLYTGIMPVRYRFGETLGPQLYQVPVLVTLHWFLPVYGAGVISRLFKTSKPVKIFTGALALLVLDAFIEPVAVNIDMWGWQSGQIPIVSYLVRLVMFAVVLALFNYIRFRKKNPVALSLFILQALFYMVLYAFM